MTINRIIEEVAKLEGWRFDQSKHGHWFVVSPSGESHEPRFGYPNYDSNTGEKITHQPTDGCEGILPDYLNSLDAIIPVIKKICWESMDTAIKFERQMKSCFGVVGPLPALTTPPAHLAEAILRAAGKWEE